MARLSRDLRDVMGKAGAREDVQEFIEGTPLLYCIKKFGGLGNFCKAINRSTRQIYRWRNAGGLISAEAQTEALIAAKRLGISLNRSKLVYMPPELEASADKPESE